MTYPTQAQIEAAKFGIVDLMNRNPDTSWDEVAVVALTAAAEVGEQEQHDAQTERYVLLGNATIERCAQVADDFSTLPTEHWIVLKRQIAAAIRALKDKP